MVTSLVCGHSCVPGQLINGPAFFSALERVHCPRTQSCTICRGCLKLEWPEFQSELCHFLAMTLGNWFTLPVPQLCHLQEEGNIHVYLTGMFWGLKWVNSHKTHRTVLSLWQAPYLLLLLLFCWAWSLTLPRGFCDFVHVTFAFNTLVSSSSIRLKWSSLLILQAIVMTTGKSVCESSWPTGNLCTNVSCCWY